MFDISFRLSAWKLLIFMKMKKIWRQNKVLMRKMKQRNTRNGKNLDMSGRISGISHKENEDKTEFIESVDN